MLILLFVVHCLPFSMISMDIKYKQSNSFAFLSRALSAARLKGGISLIAPLSKRYSARKRVETISV
jgi:hypothetical protein